MPDMLPKIRQRPWLRTLIEVFGGQACRAAPLLQTLDQAALLRCFPVAPNVRRLERR
jgi:hypothetical protein